MYQKLPNDPFITEMDPVLKIWHYEQWLGDQRDNAELAKNHAYLVGSFWNPEAVKQMLNDNVHDSTDEEYEESLRIVREANMKSLDIELDQKTIRKRKRRRIKD